MYILYVYFVMFVLNFFIEIGKKDWYKVKSLYIYMYLFEKKN